LAQHILYKHETNKPWKCEKCDFAHASRKGLNAHIRHNHKSENDLHVCHICAYKAKSKANMKEHIECVHEKLRFQCQVCEKEFSSKSKLKSHVKLSHLGELLECKECGETFNERNRLYLHVKKVHKGVEYRCKICKKDFRDARGLKRHEINIHGVEHEYKSGPNKGSVMKPGALK
jgi:KRAB domain-containing zinc finger protein